MRKPLSLTMKLFLCVSALNIVTMIVVGIVGMYSARINISEDYDAQLITQAGILWEILEEDSKDGKMSAFNLESLDAENTANLLQSVEKDSMFDYAQWRAFRVWHGDKIVMHSDNSDIFPARPFPHGFTNFKVGKDVWRAFSLHDPQNELIVTTFENLRDRDILQRDMLLDIIAPLVILFPLLGLIFSFGVGFGLNSLKQLATRLATRNPSDLSYLDSADLPRELKPLASAVNSLLSKLKSSLTHEREFIDHAAHELRTPLSALKLQAQLLDKSITDRPSRQLMTELLASVDRSARLIDQLLLMSRMSQQQITLEPVRLHDEVEQVLKMMAVRILDKHIQLDWQGDKTLMIDAQPELLRTLISTLVDNAIKYTPHEGRIIVALTRGETCAMLAITDSGSGIPEEERGRVFGRFYRVVGTSQPGSGLGLAIASQISQLFGASITMETPENEIGLRLVIRFNVK